MTFRTIALMAAVIGLVPGCASMHRAPYQPPLLNPRGIEMNQTAPATFRARFETTKGDVVIEAHREWAPHGVDRFYNLVNGGFFEDIRFFRVIDRFMAQFGIHGDPAVSSVWSDESIPDDPVVASNVRGTISFATAGPNTRTTQMFINLVDNVRLDGMGFSPIGEVVEGMEVVDQLHAEYGEGAPSGRGPSQDRIHNEGNDYLSREFPELDGIVSARLEQVE